MSTPSSPTRDRLVPNSLTFHFLSFDHFRKVQCTCMTPEQFAHLHRYQYASTSRPDLSKFISKKLSSISSKSLNVKQHSTLSSKRSIKTVWIPTNFQDSSVIDIILVLILEDIGKECTCHGKLGQLGQIEPTSDHKHKGTLVTEPWHGPTIVPS